jgi:geranylgeranyl pyrophosphate synthase
LARAALRRPQPRLHFRADARYVRRDVLPIDPHPAIFAPLPIIEAHLERTLRAAFADGDLRSAMMYSALGGGKRLRPILAWHCCEAVSEGKLAGDASLPAGAAIELVHCFSLVHDDLPALDNDDLRRGKPTLHKHAGEAMAILAGDALLTLAFEVLAHPSVAFGENVARHHAAHCGVDYENFYQRDTAHASALRVQVALLRELARATNLMIQGQVWDTLPDKSQRDAAQALDRIHSHKTGALLSAACRMGAMLGLAHDDEHALLPITTYAHHLGVLFQAVDDLLDVTQSAEHTGKRTNKDADAGKLTFPSIYGVQGTQRRIAHLREQALDAIQPLGERAATLRLIADFLAARTK